MKGDIVFVRFSYTDLTTAKPRPALVLHEERDEVVLAYISSAEINTKIAACYRL